MFVTPGFCEYAKQNPLVERIPTQAGLDTRYWIIGTELMNLGTYELRYL